MVIPIQCTYISTFRQIRAWRRHQMETFSASLAICADKGQWRGALMFSLICLNKRLSKQSWGWWFETPSRPLWRHCNGEFACCQLCCRRSQSWHHSNFHTLSTSTLLCIFLRTRMLENVFIGNWYSKCFSKGCWNVFELCFQLCDQLHNRPFVALGFNFNVQLRLDN